MNDSEWHDYLRRASIPLREIGVDGMPDYVASCALVDYAGKRVVLTVQHATGDMGQWAIEIEFDS